MSIVLDTNVLVSGLLRGGVPPGRIVDLVVTGQVRVALDGRILAEYRDVLLRHVMFLEVAVAAHTPTLVTGNARHFPPDLRRGVRVLSPRLWLERSRELLARAANPVINPGELRPSHEDGHMLLVNLRARPSVKAGQRSAKDVTRDL